MRSSWFQMVCLPVCSFFCLFQSDVNPSLNFVNHFRLFNPTLKNFFLVTFDIVLLIFLFVTCFNCLDVLCKEILLALWKQIFLNKYLTHLGFQIEVCHFIFSFLMVHGFLFAFMPQDFFFESNHASHLVSSLCAQLLLH